MQNPWLSCGPWVFAFLYNKIVKVQLCFYFALIPTGVLALVTIIQSMIGQSTQKRSGTWTPLTDLILRCIIVELVDIYGERLFYERVSCCTCYHVWNGSVNVRCI